MSALLASEIAPRNLRLVPIPINQLGATMAQWVPFVAEIAKAQRCFIEQRLGEIFKGEIAPILIMDGNKPIALVLYMIVVRGHDRIFRFEGLEGSDRERWIEL